MLIDDASSGTSESLTEETVASVFEDALSEDPEYKDDNETPPTQQSPESESDTDEVEPSSEQGQSEEDESAETEESDEEQAEQPQTYRTKVNGEEVEVTLDELLKGYSRTQDYTRKTQEVAAQRKAAEDHVNALRVERERTAAQLAQLEQAIVEQTPQEPDWAALQREDPERFISERANWSLYNERMAALRKEREQAEQLVIRDRQEALQNHLRAEQEKLLEVIPEWKDGEKAKAEKAKLVEFAAELGYTQDDLRDVRDHRALVLLRDAFRYRELMKNKPAITKKIEKVKAATPGPSGANRRPPRTKASNAFERLEKTGSQDALASVFEATVLAD